MANLRVFPYSHHDDATLTTSGTTATGDFALTNTQNHIRSKVWRATTNGAMTIKGTFATSQKATGFFVFGHNVSGITLQLYSDTAWTTSVYGPQAAYQGTADSTFDGWPGITADPDVADAPFMLHFAEKTIRSYTISIASGGDPHQITTIWLGKAFEVAINPAYGLALGFATVTDRNRSRGGSLRTNVAANWRTLEFDLSWMNEGDRGVWIDMMRKRGTGRPIVVSAFPEDGTRKERDHTMLCMFSSLNAIGRQVSWLTKRVQLEEV